MFPLPPSLPPKTASSHSLRFPDIKLALSIALRELRSGLKGFRIFLACLFLGVAAISMVGSLSLSITEGLKNDGQKILGGDLKIEKVHLPLAPDEVAWLAERGSLSQTQELRSMARVPVAQGPRRMVELHAVDQAYPLYGEIVLEGADRLDKALSKVDGQWGIAIPSFLSRQLNVQLGDSLAIGDIHYRITAFLQQQPDISSRAFAFGASVLVSLDSMADSGLTQPGSLVEYGYRLALAKGADIDALRKEIDQAFPENGWRIGDASNAAPRINEFVGLFGSYLKLVGLATLLMGGVGIANAVRGHIDSKVGTIATLKCLGASQGFIFVSYLFQVLLLSSIAIIMGMAVGAATPWLAAQMAQNLVNWQLATGPFWAPLFTAAAFGLLTVLIFSIWPLSRTGLVSPAQLFRGLSAATPPSPSTSPGKAAFIAIAFCAALLVLLTFVHASPSIALGFLGGSLAVIGLYRLVGGAVIALARKLPRPRHPAMRTALGNIDRFAAQTRSILLSIGPGLTLLVVVALLEGNIRHAISQSLPEEAPGLYFIDIQPRQIEEFEAIVEASEGVTSLQHVPMLRGRITALKGAKVSSLDIPEEVAWVFRGDRGLTWSAAPPPGAELVRGQWWDQTEQGNKVSLDETVALAMGLEIGDSITVNVLGRDLDFEIANTRNIDWSGLQINFVMVFSPGIIARAPQTQLATLKASPATEEALEIQLTDHFSNISSIRVKEALGAVAQILTHLSLALKAIAGLALLVGILILGGAIAASHKRRVYDSIVLKVLGASRRSLALTFFTEFGILSLVAALVAAVVGSLAAWVVTVVVFRLNFVLLPSVVILVPLTGLISAAFFGYIGTWSALRQKPASLLRNE